MLNKTQRANVAHVMSTALDDGVITQDIAYHRIGESHMDSATPALVDTHQFYDVAFYEIIHGDVVLARNTDYMVAWRMYCALKREAKLVAWYTNGQCRVEFTRH